MLLALFDYDFDVRSSSGSQGLGIGRISIYGLWARILGARDLKHQQRSKVVQHVPTMWSCFPSPDGSIRIRSL